MPNVPIVNAGLLYINGLQLSYASTTTFAVAAGQCRDSSNVNDITSSDAVTVNAAASGAAGLDQGTIAASTFYAVYAIADSNGYATTSALISTNTSSPLLPSEYDMYRRIGYVLTSGTSTILSFVQIGGASDRWMWYDVAINELTAGVSASYVAINLASSVPAMATEVILLASLTPSTAGGALNIRPTGSTATVGYAVLSGDVNAVITTANMRVPCNSTPSIDYKVTGAVSMEVSGYMDQL